MLRNSIVKNQQAKEQLSQPEISDEKPKLLEDYNKMNERKFAEAAISTPAALDFIEKLPSLAKPDDNFQYPSRGAKKLLNELYAENKNYFVRSRIEQVLNFNSYTPDLKNKYNEKKIKYQLEPLLANKYADREWAEHNCTYSRISDKYAVIYDFDGNIDSFFKLQKDKQAAARMDLTDILKNEDYLRNKKEELAEIICFYKTLIIPGLRDKIENDFGINLNDFDIRTQMQFINFIGDKEEAGVREVIEFTNQGESEDSAKNRIKSFLSIESGQEMGGKILQIGKSLSYDEDDVKAADELFAEYSRLVDGAGEEAENISKIYNDIFFDKRVDQDQLSRGILKKASKLLSQASDDLAIASGYSKDEVARELINKLKTQEKVRQAAINDLKDLALELNKKTKQVDDYWQDQEWQEDMNFLKKDLENDPDYNDEEREAEYNEIAKKFAANEIEDPEARKKFIRDAEQWNKYDSKRIKEIINELENNYKENRFTDSILKLEDYMKMWKVSGEEAEEILERKRKFEEDRFKPVADRLKEILELQSKIEDQLDEFVYGYNMPILPSELSPEHAEKINNAFTRIAEGAEKQADEIANNYKEIFHEKGADAEKAREAIINQAKDIINESVSKSSTGEIKDEKQFVEETISRLKQFEKAQKAAIEDLARAAEELNENYIKIDEECEKHEREIDKEKEKKKMERAGVGEDEIEDTMDMIDAQYDMNNPEMWYVMDGAHAEKETEEAEKKHYRYDSERIKENIEYFESMYNENNEEESGLLTSVESLMQGGMSQREAEKYRKQEIKDLEKRFKPLVDELKELVKFQNGLEKQLDKFVYGDKEEKRNEKGGEAVDMIFQKYKEIKKQIEKLTKKRLEELFKDKREVKDGDIDAMVDTLLLKGRKILKSYTDRIKKGEKVDDEQIIREFEDYEADSILHYSVVKSLEDVKPEDLKGVTSEKKSASELTAGGKVINIVKKLYTKETSEKRPYIPGSSIRGMLTKAAADLTQKEQENLNDTLIMLEIYGRNYEGRPTLQAKLIKGFIKRLENGEENTNIYIEKKDGKVDAFNRYDKIGPDRKYFGSFNVRPSLQDSALGTALFKTSLEQEAPGHEIEATCDAFSSASSMYIEKGQFVVERIDTDFDKDTKIPAFFIRRPKESKYYYQDYEQKDLENEFVNNFSGKNYGAYIDKPRFIQKFKAGSGDIMEKAMDIVNNHGYVISRYYLDKKTNEVYCAFERGSS